ncbi:MULTISPECIES: DedA family protein [unclassified Sphingomonas]|uniref:DedA family protein n=1 Tax=unclassified Sphingomonas TaxID=196159 RepID=UPI001F598DC3|nr:MULTISPECIES: DedA family protein [unclassified Sphingomonas]
MTIAALIARYGLAAIFLGAGLEGETAVVTGGLIAHHGLVSPIGAGLAAITGSFTADQLFFLIGRRFRNSARVRRARERPAFGRALEALERHPIAFILGFRFIYGLRTISPIAIGTSKVPTATFVPLNAISAIVWGAAFTAIGYVFGNGFERLLGRILPHHRFVLLGGAIIVIAAVAFAVSRLLRHRRDKGYRVGTGTAPE